MGSSSTATTFPRIKEVRTFIIDGVGSGGDYHNVRDLRTSPVGIDNIDGCSGQGRPLAGGQRYLDPDDPVGTISRLPYFVGYQRSGVILRRS